MSRSICAACCLSEPASVQRSLCLRCFQQLVCINSWCALGGYAKVAVSQPICRCQRQRHRRVSNCLVMRRCRSQPFPVWQRNWSKRSQSPAMQCDTHSCKPTELARVGLTCMQRLLRVCSRDYAAEACAGERRGLCCRRVIYLDAFDSTYALLQRWLIQRAVAHSRVAQPTVLHLAVALSAHTTGSVLSRSYATVHSCGRLRALRWRWADGRGSHAVETSDASGDGLPAVSEPLQHQP